MMAKNMWSFCLVLVSLQFSLAANCSTLFECVGTFLGNVASFTSYNISESTSNGTVISVIDLGNSDNVQNVFEDFKSLHNTKVNNKSDKNILTFDLSNIFDLPLNTGVMDQKLFRKTVKDSTIANNTKAQNKTMSLLAPITPNTTSTKTDNETELQSDIDLKNIISILPKINDVSSLEINNDNFSSISKFVDENKRNSSINNKTLSILDPKLNGTIFHITHDSNIEEYKNIYDNISEIKKNNSNILKLKEISSLNKENDNTKNVQKNYNISSVMNISKNNDIMKTNGRTLTFNIANLLQDELDVPGPVENFKKIFYDFSNFSHNFTQDHIDVNINNSNNYTLDFGSFFKQNTMSYANNNNPERNYANIFENLGLINGLNHSVVNIALTKSPVTKSNTLGLQTDQIKDHKNIDKKEPANKNKSLNFEDYFMDYYEDMSDNSTDYPIIDYVEFYKDTTNEKVTYVPTEKTNLIEQLLNAPESDNIVPDASVAIEYNANDVKNGNVNLKGKKSFEDASVSKVIYPWIVAIFLKNSSSNEFTYICDGALLSPRKILTAAQCVTSGNLTNISPLDLLVIAGKRSLQTFTPHEKALKIETISIHENYTYNEGVSTNDLAVLQTEEAVELNDYIQPISAIKNDTQEFNNEVTTAWSGDGSLVPVALKMIHCQMKNYSLQNVYCCTYRNDVTGCPSYGGIHAVKINENDGWVVKGIFSGDVAKRSPYCVKQIFTYTSLYDYSAWISDNIK